MLVENLPLKSWLKDLEEGDETEDKLVQNAPASTQMSTNTRDQDDAFTPYIPEENFMTEYTDETLRVILDKNKEMVDLLKKYGKSKYTADRILLIFDDQVGSCLFGGQRDNYFKGVNTRHRHYSASMLEVSQGYKEIPKTIRTNWTGVIIFEIGNEREVFCIYEEYAMGLKWEAWKELYDYATKDEHCFMFLDYQKPRGARLMKNFEQYLSYSVDAGEDDPSGGPSYGEETTEREAQKKKTKKKMPKIKDINRVAKKRKLSKK